MKKVNLDSLVTGLSLAIILDNHCLFQYQQYLDATERKPGTFLPEPTAVEHAFWQKIGQQIAQEEQELTAKDAPSVIGGSSSFNPEGAEGGEAEPEPERDDDSESEHSEEY